MLKETKLTLLSDFNFAPSERRLFDVLDAEIGAPGRVDLMLVAGHLALLVGARIAVRSCNKKEEIFILL